MGDTLLQFITGVIIIIGTFNLVRLTLFMVAADVYDIKSRRSSIRNRELRYPPYSVLIPAYNEELTIEKTVKSVMNASYLDKEIFVIDDGSTDDTSNIVQRIKQEHPLVKLELIRQVNAGKGAALNNGIAHASGELIMVLDADSTIAKDALIKSVPYFLDKKIKAIASNVVLRDNGSWLALLQRVEFVLAYRMKRSLTTLNIEYIVGGVGSVYRASILKQVFGYRHNTITEDIDLSMKVISRGNKAYRVAYASDVKTVTEPVINLGDLLKQRYRWKFGRLQSFVRYKHLFFNRHKKHGKLFGWYQLPFAIFGELYLILEPFFFGAILFVAAYYGDLRSLMTAIGILGFFMSFNFIASEDLNVREKITFIYLIPIIYFILPLLAFIEMFSLIKTIKNWRKLNPDTNELGSWTHVARA